MRKQFSGSVPAMLLLMGIPAVILLVALAAEAGWIATLLGSERAPLGTFVNAWAVGAATAFLIGFGATLLIARIALAANWGSFSIRVGPIRLFDFTGRTGATAFAFTFRGELLLLALLAGLLYALGAS